MLSSQRFPQLINNMQSFARKMSTARTTSKSFGGHWQPFTDHRKANHDPKVFARADGMFYYTEDNKEILDGTSGLWCVNAGHNQKRIVEAVQKQVATLDYAHSFNTSHRGASEFAQRLCDLLPGRNFSDVFFTMCGSTAVDTSLKIALQYYRAKGEGQRTCFIGRERGYHGVGFGGISVGGISPNRKMFAGQLLPRIDHLPHTHSLKDMAFSKGCPTWGAHLADELERICALHDPSTIAAVIIEPVAGSTGVLPPPVGYLKKIRDICTKHGILLIFDEVITGFGRTGASFGTEKFDVTPDMITCAKGLTNAIVPAGAVMCQSHIFETIHTAAHPDAEINIDMFHGYTYR
jgi:beta-alanine--pyruvate transaminase